MKTTECKIKYFVKKNTAKTLSNIIFLTHLFILTEIHVGPISFLAGFISKSLHEFQPIYRIECIRKRVLKNMLVTLFIL